jgi:hypothetical protein
LRGVRDVEHANTEIQFDVIVREVPPNELQGTLTDMELTLDTCAE